MSSLAWLIIIFFVLCFLVLLVYGLVVKAFYWGDRGEPPKKDVKWKMKNEEDIIFQSFYQF